jgi:hypothetical protein
MTACTFPNEKKSLAIMSSSASHTPSGFPSTFSHGVCAYIQPYFYLSLGLKHRYSNKEERCSNKEEGKWKNRKERGYGAQCKAKQVEKQV